MFFEEYLRKGLVLKVWAESGKYRKVKFLGLAVEGIVIIIRFRGKGN